MVTSWWPPSIGGAKGDSLAADVGDPCIVPVGVVGLWPEPPSPAADAPTVRFCEMNSFHKFWVLPVVVSSMVACSIYHLCNLTAQNKSTPFINVIDR